MSWRTLSWRTWSNRHFIQLLRRWIALAAVALIIGLGAASVTNAAGDKTLMPNVTEALNRFTSGHQYPNAAARARDQALLFANNDAINAARLNREISDSVYQAAQTDFNQLNTKFGRRAAQSAGADFTVQTRTSQTFSPGTDSDYITIVKNKEQIGRMQSDYNRRVNDFLTKNGAIDQPRPDWQKKLDTDFMADPAHVSEADFRDIAKMNNDAYKRRMAAEYERISRSGGGRIGPEHVSAYTEEMSDFVRKKRGKISEMFKNPSLFNDPANRAKVIQMMAQEQKYISRIESLDDFLRAQEGLPKRSRIGSIARQGAIRDPHNVAAIRDAHQVAEATRAKAIEDLAETMGEVAKRNPHFSGSAVDDLARVLAEAPAANRARAIANLTKTNPELAEAVLRRNPALSSADDILHVGDDLRGLGHAGEELGDAAKLGRMRKGLNAAADAMEKLGKVAATIDVAVAASQMKDYIDTIRKALDPNTTDEEAADLLEKARTIAEELAKSSALIAIMERHPAVAIIYGTWTVGCAAGEWVVSSSEIGQLAGRTNETCLDRQMSAWDNLVGTYGTEEEKKAQQEALCNKLKTAVKQGRIKIRYPNNTEDVCNSLKRGEKIAGMLEDPTGPKSTEALCGNLSGRVNAAGKLVDKGDLATAQGLLDAARAKLTDAGPQNCPGMDKRIADQQGRIASQAAIQKAQAEAAISKCLPSAYSTISNLPNGPEKTSLLTRWETNLAADSQARDLITDAQTSEGQGDSAGALTTLQRAKALKPCDNTTATIDSAIDRMTTTRIADAEAALDACKFTESHQLIDGLPKDARRQTLVDRWNKTYDGERKARDLIKEAVSLKKQGEYDRAIGKMHDASDATSCDKTAAAIDKAIAAIGGERDEGNRRCRAEFGAGSLASRPLDNGKFECKCQDGFIWNDMHSACIRRPPTIAEGHPVCRREFGPQAHAIAVNPNGTFKCQCSSGYAIKNKRCQRITIADGHRQCRAEFGSGSYAIAINPNGTFKCQCRDGYRWTAGNKRCVRLTIAEGHAACRRQFGPGSHATGYRGNGSWNCYIPPRIPPHIERPRPPAPPPHRECPPGYNPYGCR